MSVRSISVSRPRRTGLIPLAVLIRFLTGAASAHASQTATPTEGRNEASVYEAYVCGYPGVSVLGSPATKTDVVDRLKFGEVLLVLGKDGVRLHVRTARNTEGWVIEAWVCKGTPPPMTQAVAHPLSSAQSSGASETPPYEVHICHDTSVPLESDTGQVVARLAESDSVTVLEAGTEKVRVKTRFGAEGYLGSAWICNGPPAAAQGAAQSPASQPVVSENAKGHRMVTIQVVDTQDSQRQFTYYIPGTPSQSTTNCNANASVYGSGNVATANGTENCQTTTTQGRAPSTGAGSIAQEHVYAVYNGTHITLWCQAGFRRCTRPSPGTYQADISGNSVWLYTYDLDGVKVHKTKYRYVGGW